MRRGRFTKGKKAVLALSMALMAIAGARQTEKAENFIVHAEGTDDAEETTGLVEDKEAKDNDENIFMAYRSGTGVNNAFDIMGLFNGSKIRTTYYDNGYLFHICVDGQNKQITDFTNGKVYTVNDIQYQIILSYMDNGRAIKMTYNVYNTTDEKKIVKYGCSADTKIGDTDKAAVTVNSNDSGRFITMTDDDTRSNTYGARFSLCSIDEFESCWIGKYLVAADNVFTNLDDGTVVEKVDSGMAWSFSSELEGHTKASKSCYMKIDTILEIEDSSVMADAVNKNLILNVPYYDTKNRIQTLFYKIDNGEFVEYETKLNTNDAENNVFENISVSVADLNWEANSEHVVSLKLEDDGRLKSRTLEYSVKWPEVNAESDEACTVEYKNTNNHFANMKVTKNTAIDIPIDSQTGFDFLGWGEEETGNKTVLKGGEKYTVTGDKTFYAKWAKLYPVVLNLTKDGSAYTGQTVSIKAKDENQPITYDLTKSGNTYKSSSVREGQYDVLIDGVPTGAVLDVKDTVNNSYSAELFTVTYMNGEEIFTQVEAAKDNKLVLIGDEPENAEETAKFEGWYKDAEGTEPADTEMIVSEAIIVYAYWTYAGDGSVDISDWTYGGKAVAPEASTEKNDAENITITYAGTGSTEYKESEKAPTEAGTYKVKAVFGAKGNIREAVAEKEFKINKAASEIALSVADGKDVNNKVFTAVVKGVNDEKMTGTVVFYDGAKELSSVKVSGNKATYSMTLVEEKDVLHNITAKYIPATGNYVEATSEKVSVSYKQILYQVDVSYQTHVQTYGWQGWKKNGESAGTSGQAKRLEGINIKVSGNKNLGIQYTTHCQTYGWLPWSKNGEMSGTEGEAKRLEAIEIQLTGKDKDKYDVYYRVHAQSYGWLGWAKNGAPAGTAGLAKRLEAIQIVVVLKGQEFDKSMGGVKSANEKAYVSSSGDPIVAGANTSNVLYKTHVQSYGWQGWKYNGTLAGTEGKAKRLESIKIKLSNAQYSGGITYRTHVQSYGWQDWKSDGKLSGTEGEGKRLEAIEIKLTGEMAKQYDVYYRVHAQSYGWLGWAKNGESAGTEGKAKRLESIQIVLVKKGGKAPGSTDGAFVK